MSMRPDEVLAAIRGLPEGQRREVLARAFHESRGGEEPGDPLSFVGMFANEPELIDAVCEDAMAARECDPLRLAIG